MKLIMDKIFKTYGEFIKEFPETPTKKVAVTFPKMSIHYTGSIKSWEKICYHQYLENKYREYIKEYLEIYEENNEFNPPFRNIPFFRIQPGNIAPSKRKAFNIKWEKIEAEEKQKKESEEQNKNIYNSLKNFVSFKFEKTEEEVETLSVEKKIDNAAVDGFEESMFYAIKGLQIPYDYPEEFEYDWYNIIYPLSLIDEFDYDMPTYWCSTPKSLIYYKWKDPEHWEDNLVQLIQDHIEEVSLKEMEETEIETSVIEDEEKPMSVSKIKSLFTQIFDEEIKRTIEENTVEEKTAEPNIVIKESEPVEYVTPKLSDKFKRIADDVNKPNDYEIYKKTKLVSEDNNIKNEEIEKFVKEEILPKVYDAIQEQAEEGGYTLDFMLNTISGKKVWNIVCKNKWDNAVHKILKKILIKEGFDCDVYKIVSGIVFSCEWSD